METTITPYGCSRCAGLRPNLLIKAAAVLLALVATVTAQQRTIIGVYKNFAEGFAVRIPQALKVSPETNPGRNVESAFLCCWDTCNLYGEPNSLEWTHPEEGVRYALQAYCPASEQTIAPAK